MASFEEKTEMELLGPKAWDRVELILAEAQEVGPVRPCDLQATGKFPLHAFFSPDRWQAVDRENYEILLPSMQLASNLIQVGMPYLCSFVPSNRAHDHLADTRPGDPNFNSYEIIHQQWDEDDIEETRDDLHDIANCVEWELNDTIASDNKWMGITRLVTAPKWGPRPWKDLLRDDITRSDNELKEQGASRRNLKVGIMQEYVDALKRYPNTSEEHLRATFLAAVTMTHEVGHIVWHQDFRSTDYDANGKEPYFEDYSVSELGLCFIASIFDGKNPFECGKQVPTDFTKALYWEKLPKMNTDELYRTDHSMSIPYIQRILSQESWDRLDPRRATFVVEARAMLKPAGDPVQIPAAAHIREWTVIEINAAPKVIWKTQLEDRRIRNDAKLKYLTEAEEEFATYELSLTNPGAFKDKIRSSILPDVALPHDILDDDDTRPVDDGIVALDLVRSGQAIDLKNLTRIEVRYRPKPGDFKEQDGHHFRPQKPQPPAAYRYGVRISHQDWFCSLDPDSPNYNMNVPKDFQFGGPNDYYEPADVLALIANKQPEIIARTTIKDAYQFCFERDLRFGRRLPSTFAEQNQKLDRTKEADRALIERMRQFCLKTAEKLFVGNNQAILYLYFAELKYIDDWDYEDLLQKCAIDAVNHSDSLDSLRLHIKDHMLKLFRGFADEHNLPQDEESFKKVGLVDEIDLVTWTEADFINFFTIHNLPTWGNRRIWFERHAAFKREQTYGLARRSDINHDSKGEIKRSIDMVETYAWDAVLAGTSVQALKGTLFEAGMFPSDSTLDLYFGRARQTPLEDNKPLSYYDPASWTTLSLVVTRTSQEEKPDIEMANVETPVLVYKPRLPAGAIFDTYSNTSNIGGTGNPGQRLGSISQPPGSNNTKTQPPPRSHIPKYVQRIYNLTHNKARPTITEHLSSLHTRAEELSRILCPLGARDTLRPHLTALRSKSAVEMLDSYEDMQEVCEDRQRFIDVQVDPEGVIEEERRKRVKLVDEGNGDGDGEMGFRSPGRQGRKVGGFMRDLHGALRKRGGLA